MHKYYNTDYIMYQIRILINLSIYVQKLSIKLIVLLYKWMQYIINPLMNLNKSIYEVNPRFIISFSTL
jgi:hypothetical protein